MNAFPETRNGIEAMRDFLVLGMRLLGHFKTPADNLSLRGVPKGRKLSETGDRSRIQRKSCSVSHGCHTIIHTITIFLNKRVNSLVTALHLHCHAMEFRPEVAMGTDRQKAVPAEEAAVIRCCLEPFLGEIPGQ